MKRFFSSTVNKLECKTKVFQKNSEYIKKNSIERNNLSIKNIFWSLDGKKLGIINKNNFCIKNLTYK